MINAIIITFGALGAIAISWIAYIIASSYISHKKDINSFEQSQNDMKESMRHYD